MLIFAIQNSRPSPPRHNAVAHLRNRRKNHENINIPYDHLRLSINVDTAQQYAKNFPSEKLIFSNTTYKSFNTDHEL